MRITIPYPIIGYDPIFGFYFGWDEWVFEFEFRKDEE